MAEKRNKLFDISQARGPSRNPHVGGFGGSSKKGKADKDGLPSNAMGVAQLLSKVKSALTNAFPSKVTVVGELSNLSRPASGHIYFSLKDADSSVGACMWRSAASKLKFTPTDGMEVIVEGKVDVYPAQGKLQLYATKIMPRGMGALELAFRQLKDKLQAEGLFDPAIKKEIPKFPRAVGVITSATGAAVRDIQRTIRRRFPAMTVYLLPAMVQGDGAAEELAQAVTLMDAHAVELDIDTIIVGRGGGSIEDLWAFNEEVLARAIAQANTPIISGVGHEVDVTICDMVADLRVATPTAGAEHAVPDRAELLDTLELHYSGITRNIKQRLNAAWLGLSNIERSTVFRDPSGGLRHKTQRLDELSARLSSSQRGLLSHWQGVLSPLSHRLAGLHPARLCERGKARVDNMMARLRWVLGSRSKRAGDSLSNLQRRLGKNHPANELKLAAHKLDALQRHLNAMSYRSVLERGYSVTKDANGNILTDPAEMSAGDIIKTELAKGTLTSTVGQGEQAVAVTKKNVKKRKSKKSPRDDGPGLFGDI